MIVLEKCGAAFSVRKAVQKNYAGQREFAEIYMAAIFRQKGEFRRAAKAIRREPFYKEINRHPFDEVILTGEAAGDFPAFRCVCRILGRIPLRLFGNESGAGKKEKKLREQNRALFLWAALLYERLGSDRRNMELKKELKRVTRSFLNVLFLGKAGETEAARRDYEEMLDWMEAALWRN